MSNDQIRESYLPPPPPEVEFRLPPRFTPRQLQADRTQLRILASFYTLVAFLLSIAGVVALGYFLIGLALVFGVLGPAATDGPRRHALILSGSAFGLGAVIWALAAGVIAVARSLRRRKRYLYCIITAGLFCALPPLGTVLGLCTILVLLRTSVQEVFTHGDQAFQTDSEKEARLAEEFADEQ